MDTALFALPAENPKHPAKYTDALLVTFARMLKGRQRILDPFAGTGKVFLLNHWLPDAEVSGVEIEREWAEQHPRTTLGNALHLPWPDGYFDALVTSPGYGNRLADKLLRDRHKRKTYASELARELHPDNGGALPWGRKYRAFHLAAWTEARRVLEPGGLFALNIKDHIRRGVVQPVTDWHIEALEGLGFQLLEHVHIDCPGMRFGQNRDARVDYESVILFQQGSAYGAQSRNPVPAQK